MSGPTAADLLHRAALSIERAKVKLVSENHDLWERAGELLFLVQELEKDAAR